jgi:hypothetical protein
MSKTHGGGPHCHDKTSNANGESAGPALNRPSLSSHKRVSELQINGKLAPVSPKTLDSRRKSMVRDTPPMLVHKLFASTI